MTPEIELGNPSVQGKPVKIKDLKLLKTLFSDAAIPEESEKTVALDVESMLKLSKEKGKE